MPRTPVLIVAQNVDLGQLLAQCVGDLGHQAYTASSVAETLRLLATRDYSLILANYMGPRGRYFERWPILPILSRFAPRTPVIAFSAFGGAAATANVASVLPLPFESDDLSRAIQQLALPTPALSRDPFLARYLAALWEVNAVEAGRVVEQAFATGWAPAKIHEDLFAPAMYVIGEWWSLDCCTVAGEHGARVITERLMAAVANWAVRKPPNGRAILFAALPGERHELGILTAADLFDWDGWRVYALGADTPAADLVGEARRLKPDVVGLSGTMPSDHEQLKSLVAALRAAGVPRVILGGQALCDLDSIGITSLGADACALTASAGVNLANQFFERASGA